MTIYPAFKLVTRKNVHEMLRHVPCPCCSIPGNFTMFCREFPPSNIGLQCLACKQEHPFMAQGFQWVPSAIPRSI